MMYYIYDTDGYYVVTVDADVAPEKSTTIAPELKDGYWAHFNGTAWEDEKIPATAEDIVGLSFPAPPADPMDENQKDTATQHQSILRSICDRIIAGDPHARKVVKDGVITIVAVTDADLEAEHLEELFTSLRAERDKRLAETDYLLSADYPIDADKLEAVKTYRQSLRDLPSQEGAPWDGGGEGTPWPVLSLS